MITKQEIFTTRFGPDRTPKSPVSFQCDIPRSSLEKINFEKALEKEELLRLYYKKDGRGHWLEGTVEQIYTCRLGRFRPTKIILLRPKLGCGWDEWEVVPILFAAKGRCSVLS